MNTETVPGIIMESAIITESDFLRMRASDSFGVNEETFNALLMDLHEIRSAIESLRSQAFHENMKGAWPRLGSISTDLDDLMKSIQYFHENVFPVGDRIVEINKRDES